MYSDTWLTQGYSSREPIQVSDFVFYRIWQDQAGSEIGVTVDFEAANDFHYEMPVAEWQRFLKTLLGVDQSDEVTDAFRGYFIMNKGLFDFESDLRIHGIGFQKIAF